MKRVDLVRYLLDHGCELLREAGRHSVYVNRRSGKSSTVPRHREINEFLAKKIFKDLELEQPK
jgi:mRNA interferase HicA